MNDKITRALLPGLLKARDACYEYNRESTVLDVLEDIDALITQAQAEPDQPEAADVGVERKAFEAWYLSHFYMGDKQCGLEWLSTEPCGGYRHQHPAELWVVWQARAALSPAGGGMVTDAARDVLVERQRQISAEGWTPEHDDTHNKYPHELAIAGACYALCASGEAPHVMFGIERFPWPGKGAGENGAGPSPKGGSRRMLVKAAALLIAEIERIDRLNAPPQANSQEAEEK